jgi:hypothetical protein
MAFRGDGSGDRSQRLSQSPEGDYFTDSLVRDELAVNEA